MDEPRHLGNPGTEAPVEASTREQLTVLRRYGEDQRRASSQDPEQLIDRGTRIRDVLEDEERERSGKRVIRERKPTA
jgi:hypothetical protein